MTAILPTRQNAGVSPNSNGITFERKNDGHTIVFTWTNVSRETVNEFSRIYSELLSQWPVEESFNLLNDLRFKGFNMTPYLQHAVQQAVQEATALGIRERVAILLMPDLGMRVAQFFLRALPAEAKVRAEIFSDYDKAMKWLDQPLEH